MDTPGCPLGCRYRSVSTMVDGSGLSAIARRAERAAARGEPLAALAHLAALAAAVREATAAAIRQALSAGWTGGDVARARGISRQAVHKQHER